MMHTKIILKESLRWQSYQQRCALRKCNRIKLKKPYEDIINSHKSISDKCATANAIYNNLYEN